jgi:hypothetical protein
MLEACAMELRLAAAGETLAAPVAIVQCQTHRSRSNLNMDVVAPVLRLRAAQDATPCDEMIQCPVDAAERGCRNNGCLHAGE